MLHIIKSSPYATHALSHCLAYATPDSVIVLINDAVLGALANSPLGAALFTDNRSVYVLEEDVMARGVQAHLHPQVKQIDMQGLVQLTEDHVTQMTW
ncbi:sulfurtransferase complex subunit TusB [Salinivibrio sp. IB872]|jgi:tRNA 2-thiouridine synthesizing protein B|uniref:sulfurtransferase complex subunit TusB n=1 Tax=Salinivibrio sp. IB872 TaxID=1766123 RepID=UPI00098706AE|nr:sulfurtransferase complex subunit TusB [Salinivibrio sp. IB872]OOF29363.1 hypothetical protein BZJ18_02020 [Salinivibrio sp. IB872]